MLALGSNLGDRAQNIDAALRRVHAAVGAIVDTSFLYETRPAYVEAQPSFLNAACRVYTRLPPAHLLATVKRIEHLLYVSEYKRRQAPPGVKISSRNFGRDRRYPITNAFRDAR
jgi:2-amino-4-hydroxy-6-hydroxymethyldihydropteridine diphosphokinase